MQSGEGVWVVHAVSNYTLTHSELFCFKKTNDKRVLVVNDYTDMQFSNFAIDYLRENIKVHETYTVKSYKDYTIRIKSGFRAAFLLQAMIFLSDYSLLFFFVFFVCVFLRLFFVHLIFVSCSSTLF